MSDLKTHSILVFPQERSFFLFETEAMLDLHIRHVTDSTKGYDKNIDHFATEPGERLYQRNKQDVYWNEFYDTDFRLVDGADGVVFLVKRNKTSFTKNNVKGEKWHIIAGEKMGWIFVKNIFLFEQVSYTNKNNEKA